MGAPRDVAFVANAPLPGRCLLRPRFAARPRCAGVQFATFPLHGIPTSVSAHMSFDYTTGAYYPILYREEFWLLPKHLVAINNDTHALAVTQV